MPLFAPRVLGQAKPKLVVIGGGPGGGTVARYVNKDAAGAIDVTLIEPQKNSPPASSPTSMSAAFATSSRSPTLRQGGPGGVRVVHGHGGAIDRDERGGARRRQAPALRPAGGRARHRLKFDSVPGYSEAAAETMPHAWKAGAQTELLIARSTRSRTAT